MQEEPPVHVGMSCSGEMHNSSDAMQDEQGNNKVHINHCLAACLTGTGRDGDNNDGRYGING